MRYLHYLQCSPVSSLPTLHRAVCAAQCPAAGCCDCSPAPAASPCPRTRWGPGNSGHRAGRLASWYETGVGGPTVIHSITYKQPDHTLMMVSSCPCPPSPARRPGTTKGELCYSSPHSGRLAPWHETGAGAPLVDRINYILFQPYTVGCIFTSVSTITCQATWHCKRRILQQ